MCKYLILFAVIIGLATALIRPSGAMAETFNQRPLVIGVINWAPYSGEDMPNYGFATDIIRTALQKEGYETAVTFVPWARLLKGIETGKYDLLPGVWHTSEREKFIFFGDVIAENRMVIINHAFYDFEYKKLEDLRGEVVGVAIGYGYPEFFMQADYFIREEAVDLESNLRKLIYRRINLTIGDEMVARYTASKNFADAADLIKYAKVPVEETPLLFGISIKVTGYEEITKSFNHSLAKMREDGSYQAILRSHQLSDDLEP